MAILGIKYAAIIAVVAYFVYNWNNVNVTVTKDDADDVYDYVIVGAGSAGSVVANRLSENPNWKVLLLEAGGDDVGVPNIRVPIASGTSISTDVDWCYKTVPQKNACQSMHHNQCTWPRGKMLGGSSSMNGMKYIRGHAEDFNLWAELGCKGWSYEEVLPYFKKAESNKNPLYAATKYHGKDGPLIVEDNNATVMGDVFLKAGAELGYTVGDNNGEKQDGVFSHLQTTTNKGARWSTADAYLRPAMHRPNLHIVTYAHVTNVVFEGKRAIGVEYMRKGRMSSVKAHKEVILSAGAIGSAHILLLSGVGPKQHLTDLRIPMLADLPVGESLQDHLMVFEPQVSIEEPLAITTDTLGSLTDVLRYSLWGTGQLASPPGGLGHAVMIKSQSQPKTEKFTHIQIQLYHALVGSFKESMNVFNSAFNVPQDIYQETFGDVENQHGIHMVPVLLHPQSHGTIRLKSQNPFEYPLIDPSYLSDERDIEVFIEGIRIAQTLANTKSFRDVGGKLRKRPLSKCLTHAYDSDPYWECFLRNTAVTVFHPTGTCRMGPEADSTSVVDPELLVKGLESLRVVDASIMPEIISGNPNAAIIMIGEKASDLIKIKHQ